MIGSPSVFAFEVWVLGHPEWKEVVNETTASKARYDYWLSDPAELTLEASPRGAGEPLPATSEGRRTRRSELLVYSWS